jgi:hypothetical protein
MSTD